MSQSGELVTTVVLPRLAEEMGKTSGQAAMPLTDSVKELTTAWDELKRTLAQSGALEIVTDGIKGITQAVKDLVSFLKSNESWLIKLLQLVPGMDLLRPRSAEAPGTGGLAPGEPRPGDVVPPPEVRTTPTPTAPPEVNAREREIQRLSEEIDRRYQEVEALTKRATERMQQFPQSAQSIQAIMEETAAAIGKLIQEAEQLAQQLEKSMRELEQQGQQLQNQVGKTAAAISPQRAKIRQVIERLAPEYGLDPRLVEAVVKQESNFDPRAVSKAGAQGLMQLMPPTARAMGVTDPFDIEQNLRGGMKYLAQLLKQFNGDMEKALAAYNAGPGRVLEAEQTGRPLPKETLDYVPKVLGEVKRLGDEGADAMDTTAAATTTATSRMEELREKSARAHQQLEEMKRAAQQGIVDQERMAAEDRYIDLLIETQNEVNALTMSEEELARTSLDRMERQTAAARELRDAMRKDPTSVRAIVAEDLAGLLEQRQRLQATSTLDDMRRGQQQSVNEVIGGLRDQSAQLRLSTEGYMQYRLAVLGASEAESKEVTSLQKLNTAMEQIRDIGQTVFDNLSESLANFVATGKMDFKSLADAIIADLARIALRATITEWGQKLVTLGLGALGGTPSSDPAVATLTSIGSLPLRQHGGPVFSNRAYLVGEAGPELFVPGRGGTVVSNQDLRSIGDSATVHLHFPGVTTRQEADAIRRSAGQIGSQILTALERTRARNHLPHPAR
jgi:soluble lytic murein transglycosylase-like protein